jgi:hypothetical protein
MNMSYCMFENTNANFTQLRPALEALLAGVPHESLPLSREEREAAQALVMHCLEITEMLEEQLGKPAEDTTEGDVCSLLCAAHEKQESLDDDSEAQS